MAKRVLNQKNLRPAQLNNERTFAVSSSKPRAVTDSGDN